MNTVMQQQYIQPGFDDPVSSSQATFRRLLTAMSEPFSVHSIEPDLAAPDPIAPSAYALSLTLLDHHMKVMLSDELNSEAVLASLKFHCQASFVEQSQQADFIFCSEHQSPRLSELKLGSSRYPDQSATLVIQCDSFSDGPIWRAAGPGIESTVTRQCSAFNAALLDQLQVLHQQYRQQSTGVDVIFCCADQFFCIPRSTRLSREVN